MKYDSFIKLRGLGCIALIVIPVAVLVLRAKGNKAVVAPPPVAVPLAPQAPQSTNNNGLSEVDREVLRLQKEPLSKGTPDSKGLKWRLKNQGVVVELRCDKDKGGDYWNRAKVDANDNKQFDEIWTFKKDGTVERRVAPNDDQNYTQTFRLEGETWVPK